ncbi:hypothetical protein [Actinoplanes sp. NPDC026619]|uniref:hypothetical protein n=1 Tax=Actinoplanes sp. NPDC026619 TaxID=3155798 RepID=UPI0033E4EF69
MTSPTVSDHADAAMTDHPDPALARLLAHVDQLRMAAGGLKAPEISKRLGGIPGRSTVNNIVSRNSRILVSWEHVAKVVDFLGGDRGVALDLWTQAEAAMRAEPASATDAEPEILKCTPVELDLNCVLPHAADDQWVPRGVLARMAVEGLSLADLGDERDQLLRRELIRSLITARQIVINRSFLVRNPVLSRAYRDEPEERRAFTTLLSDEAIVPYLYTEKTPLESEFATEPAARQAQEVWNEILHSTVVMCVRLSWNNAKNLEATNGLQQSFADGLRRAAGSQLRMLLEDVGTSADEVDDFRKKLGHLPQLGRADAPEPVSRTLLYKHYIVKRGTDPRAGDYDFTRTRHMVPLKWVLDLVYHSNLASRLGIALITPVDSANRSVVHHPNFLQTSARRGGYNARRVQISIQEAIQHFSAGSLKVFERLTLADVVEIRTNPVWLSYARSVDALLKEPWLMSHPERGLPHVYARHQDLIDYVRRRS